MEETDKLAHDSRIILYKIIRQLVIIIFIAIVVKSCVVDSVAIRGSQMSPTLVNGDQVMVFKFPYLSFVNKVLGLSVNKPVIYNNPFNKSERFCLRIAGLPSDTVSIDSGVIYNSRKGRIYFTGREKSSMILPASYSPRDYYNNYRVPAKGDTLYPDSLTLRDFFSTVAVIRQENPKSKIAVKHDLYIDDTLSNDYFIKEFALYKGTLDTIPSRFDFDWFFWDRLDQYLSVTADDYAVDLRFTVYIDSVPVSKYTVKENFVFMLADNWSDGLDSRYNGPVIMNSITGRVFFVLWSHNLNTDRKLNFKRMGRIIR